uniref:Movement protein TGBp3 n=1 Tax=Potato virus M TaxID=12167 RepID=A0A482CD34_9VIRU|nr:TGB3 [Potato virus M]
MIVHALIGLCAFCVVLFIITQNQSDCIVLITGESVRVQGCRIDKEFGDAVSKLQPFEFNSFRS